MKKLSRVILASAAVFALTAGVCLASTEGGEAEMWKTLAYRVLNFAVVAGVLWWALADKAKNFFSGRRENIARTLEEVDQAVVAAEAKLSAYQQQLSNIENDIAAVRQLVIGEVEQEKARIIEEGRLAAEHIIEAARRSAEQEVLSARQQLLDQAAEMAAEMASAIVAKSLTPADHERLLDEYLIKVEREQ